MKTSARLVFLVSLTAGCSSLLDAGFDEVGLDSGGAGNGGAGNGGAGAGNGGAGNGGAGAGAGNGGAAGAPVAACDGLPDCCSGADCGPVSCCAATLLPEGGFPMGRGSGADACGATPNCPSIPDGREEPEHFAGVHTFALDVYEVTVGRFQKFVSEGYGTQAKPPAAGDGQNPAVPGSGWTEAFSARLPKDTAALKGEIASCADSAWGEAPRTAMNCVSWAESFAFCIWDGGFLPTEVQWEYAAAGGIENRKYPWGASEPTSEEATFGGTKGVLIPVGSHPKGRGRWGHHDLAGSRWEWTLDFFRVDWYASWTSGSVCVDCANLANADYQVFRGGGWASTAEESRVTFRAGGPTSFSYRADDIGVRCARAKAR